MFFWRKCVLVPTSDFCKIYVLDMVVGKFGATIGFLFINVNGKEVESCVSYFAITLVSEQAAGVS